jgi:sulfide:quinone oxidoreductase
MRRVTPLTDALTISDQITPDDVATLAAQGVKTILCNRPDHEEPGQPENVALKAAASAAGIAFIEQPVSFSTIRASDGATFGAYLAKTDGKVHAFCRTGRRCVALWALANAKAMGTHGVLTAAMQAGEDLRGLAPLLSEIEAQ